MFWTGKGQRSARRFESDGVWILSDNSIQAGSAQTIIGVRLAEIDVRNGLGVWEQGDVHSGLDVTKVVNLHTDLNIQGQVAMTDIDSDDLVPLLLSGSVP